MEKIIKIHLTERTDYINKYNQRILSYDLSNYILEELKGTNTKEKIKFFIDSDFEMTNLEKTNLVDMIRNNFGADISETLNISKNPEKEIILTDDKKLKLTGLQLKLQDEGV